MLSLEELRQAVDAGQIDTVIVAMTDMQGRLQGKRVHAPVFLDGMAEHGAEGCNYLMAVDVDMNTVDGYEISSWERGYGDFVFRPDLRSLRRIPWLEATALVLCDLEWHDGSPVAPSPRQVLRRQLDRLAERGWSARVASELEFIVFQETYESARAKGYRGLRPANGYNVDYSILGSTYVEPLLRRLRLEMDGAGLGVENSKGECNVVGQHEVNFRYDEALAMADGHAVYRNGAKEIAFQEGYALSFMPKYDEREGNSCHVHLSLWEGGRSLFCADDGGFTPVFSSFLAGWLAHVRELTYFLAPNVNSYKRFQPGSFAPTAMVWGHDNRSCAFRVVGHGQGLRAECRIAGGDANPYLAFAALIAAGLAGVDGGYELEPAWQGSGYDAAERPHVPSALRDAAALLAGSTLAREAFGDQVVDHYLNAARIEQDQFDRAVTDWELQRSFERL